MDLLQPRHGNIKTLTAMIFFAAFLAQPTLAQPEKITVQTIQSAVYDRMVNIGGTVIPYKEVTLTAQMPGQVNYIAGIEGDGFNSGTLLISIDDDALRAQRKAAVASWYKSSFAYQNAYAQYNRELWAPQSEQSMAGMALPNLADQLMTKPFSDAIGAGDSSAIKRADLTNAMSRVREAQANMAQIKAQIDEIDVRLNDTKSTAPFDGVIVEKLVEAGDTVQPGQALLKFAKSNHLSIEINVPVNLMQGLRKGETLQARIAGSVPIQVRVAQIFPVANGQQHTVKVKLDLPFGASAAPGMYARVAIRNASSQGQSFPIVPNSAIVKRGSLPSVFIYNQANQTVNMQVVRVSKRLKNGNRTVLSGVSTGDQVVVNPPASIRSGWVLKNGRLMPPNASTNSNNDSDA